MWSVKYRVLPARFLDAGFKRCGCFMDAVLVLGKISWSNLDSPSKPEPLFSNIEPQAACTSNEHSCRVYHKNQSVIVIYWYQWVN